MDSAAVFPGRTWNRQRLDGLEEFGFDHLEDNNRVIAVFLANVQHMAFEVGVKILEDGGGRLAVEEGLAVESHSICLCRREEFLGDFLLMASEHVQSRNAAFDEATKHSAIFAHRSHEKRRLE